jgi:hypothetical protein
MLFGDKLGWEGRRWLSAMPARPSGARLNSLSRPEDSETKPRKVTQVWGDGARRCEAR